MLKKIAQRLIGAAEHSGINAGLRAYHRGGLLALCYHGVVPDQMAVHPLLYGNAITVSEFSRQLQILMRYFRPIGANEMPDWIRGKASVHHKSVLVTFDDGYRNNLTHAMPILRRFGIPALLFVTTGYVGSNHLLWPDEMYARVLYWPRVFIPMPAPERDRRIASTRRERVVLAAFLREHCKHIPHDECMAYLNRLRQCDSAELQTNAEVLRLLSWDEIRELGANGFEIGSHTVEHPILTQIGPDRLARELADSKRAIEQKLGRPCPYFAYPNGGPDDISATVVAAVGEAGYSFAFSVNGQLNFKETDPLMLDRVYIPAGASASGFYSRISGVHGRIAHYLKLRTAWQRRPAAELRSS